MIDFTGANLDTPGVAVPSFGVVVALATVEPYLEAAWSKCRSLLQALPRDSREHEQAWDTQHYVTMARQAVRAVLSEVRQDG